MKMTTTNSSSMDFPMHVIRGKWFMLFASFFVLSSTGGTYLFGTYSGAIKASQGYDQTTLNLFGFFKNISLSVLCGLIAETTPTWLVLLLGSALNFGGYFMIWLAVTHRISKPKVWQICLYICIGSNSQRFVYTGTLVPCIKNFPESRGVMIGLLNGYIGLGGAIMTQLYLAVYGNDSESLILLLAWLPSALVVVFLFTIRFIEVDRQPKEAMIFYKILFVSFALALFLMAMIILQGKFVFSHKAYIGSVTVVCALLFAPLLIGMKQEFLLWSLKMKDDHPPQIDVNVISQMSPTVESKRIVTPSSFSVETDQLEIQKESCFASIFNKPERGADYTILQALLSIDMLLLLIGSTIGNGVCLAAMDNLGQIGESLGYPASTVSSLVSLVSIWNYFGRIFSGFVSEIFLERYKVPRPLIWTLVLFLSCVGHLLIAFPTPGSIYAASIIIGFCLGAQSPVVTATVSELFGLKHFATLFNCVSIASPIGSYALNVEVTGLLYDREAKKLLKESGKMLEKGMELTCVGSECFRLPSVVMALVNLFGALVSFILVIRTREFYKTDIYNKFRDDATTANTQEASSTAQEE